MWKRGIRVLRLRGIDVVLDHTWFIVLLLVVAGLGTTYFPDNYPTIPPLQRWVLSVVAALLLFGSVLLHEFSHSLVAQQRGMRIERIVLFLFGGVAQIRGEPPDPRSEFLIAAAGPACSLLLGIACLLLAGTLGQLGGVGLEAVLWYLGTVNLLLVAFNLVPGFPLDGGRILRALLWHRTGNLRRSTRIVSKIGKAFAAMLFGLGFLFLLYGAFGQGLFFIFIGMFLRQAAESGYQQVALREGLSGLTVAGIMTPDPVVVPASISLDEVVNDYFLRYRFASYPVARDGRLVGLIHLNQVKQVPRSEWTTTSVQACMTAVDGSLILAPDADAFEALTRMIEVDVGRMPVVSGGRIVGIVSRRDLMALVQMRAELGQEG